jgi:hypothetical protein
MSNRQFWINDIKDGIAFLIILVPVLILALMMFYSGTSEATTHTCSVGVTLNEDGSYNTNYPLIYDGEIVAEAWEVSHYKWQDAITTTLDTGLRTAHTAWSPGWRGTSCSIEVIG